MWKCSNCSELIEDDFEICWNCQFGKSGELPINTSVKESFGDEESDQIGVISPAITSNNISVHKAKRQRSAIDKLQTKDAKTEIVINLLESYLEDNESLNYWACGEKASAFILLIMIFLSLILASLLANIIVGPSLLGSLIAFSTSLAILYLFWPRLVKAYVVGLTNQRFIALRYKRKIEKSEIEEVIDYSLKDLPPTEYGERMFKIEIHIYDKQKPFSAKFARVALLNNRRNALAIGAALSKIKPLRSENATSYCPSCKSEFRKGFNRCDSCNTDLISYDDVDV